MNMVRARGFTLIEMLVGLALLGLMTLALFSALRTAVHSWERAEVKAQQVVDLRIAEGVLRREIAKSFPLRVGLANENKIGFDGDERAVNLIVGLPAHLEPRGLSRVSLGFESTRSDAGQEETSLVLKHTSLDLADMSGTPPEASRAVLIRGLEGGELAYFGKENDQSEPSWKTSWTQGERLPMLLRLRIKMSGAGDREYYFPLRLGEEAGCYQAAFQRQCGGMRR